MVALLRTYMADRDAPEARRRRGLVVIALVLFCLLYGFAFALIAPFQMTMFLAPPALVGLFVIWALPELHRPPTRSLEFLFFAYIISLAVWPNNLAIALPGLPWITFVRLSLFPMAMVFLVCLSTSAKFRSDLGTTLWASRWISILLFMFIVTQFVSIFLAKNKVDTIQFFIISQINWTLLFLVGAYIYRKPGRAVFYTRLAWGLTVFVCLIGLIEWKMGKVPWQGHVPGFLKIDDEFVAISLSGSVRAGVGVHRVQSIFTHPTTLSEYLALVVPFIVDFVVKPNRMLIRIAAALTVVMMAFVVFVTNSRTGSIGFLVAFLVYGFFWSVEQRRIDRGGMLGSLVLYGYPIAAFFGVLASIFIGRIRNKVWGGSETLNSTNGRKVQWDMGVPIIKHNPFGHGVTLQYHQANGILTVDSYYLTQLLEVGVLGFLVYYAIWVAGIVYASRTVMKIGQKDPEISLLIPIICTLTNFFIIKSAFSQMDNHPLVFSILGMGAALLYRANLKLNPVGSKSASMGAAAHRRASRIRLGNARAGSKSPHAA
jgi:hypothetical protein